MTATIDLKEYERLKEIEKTYNLIISKSPDTLIIAYPEYDVPLDILKEFRYDSGSKDYNMSKLNEVLRKHIKNYEFSESTLEKMRKDIELKIYKIFDSKFEERIKDFYKNCESKIDLYTHREGEYKQRIKSLEQIIKKYEEYYNSIPSIFKVFFRK